MSGRDAVFCGDVREQGTGAFLLTAHPLKAVTPFSRLTQLARFFSSLLELAESLWAKAICEAGDSVLRNYQQVPGGSTSLSGKGYKVLFCTEINGRG
jgi:hypothetical protein